LVDIFYDDGQLEKDVKTIRCKKYTGQIPCEGLYFTEGDAVTVESKHGHQFDEEGEIIKLEKYVVKQFQSGSRRKFRQGPFGTFTVRITSGLNRGQIIKNVKSEDLCRRIGDKNPEQDKFAVEIGGTVKRTKEIPSNTSPYRRGGRKSSLDSKTDNDGYHSGNQMSFFNPNNVAVPHYWSECVYVSPSGYRQRKYPETPMLGSHDVDGRSGLPP
jgi:hypothetical protein